MRFTASRPWFAPLLALLLLSCAASSHPVEDARLGRPASTADLVAALDAPGPVRFEKIVAGDWVVDRSGLVNLEHPTAVAAGLAEGDEPIQIYLYVLEHPEFGRYVVDSGLERALRTPADAERLGSVVRAAMNTDALVVRTSTGEWLDAAGGRLDGVFLTHMHLDHILGLPDVPRGTPVYTGPGEAAASQWVHAFVRGTTDRMLEGLPPIREWAFEPDPSGRFEGVLDVFGDASVFAIHVPGHTPGSTAFLVRTPEGPQLLVGDVSHTSWGWAHGVEPGTFSNDPIRSAESFRTLRAFAAEHPGLAVHFGHQPRDPDAERMAEAE